LFHRQGRAQSRLREHLVQLRCVGLRREHAFGRRRLGALGLLVEFARHHVGEAHRRRRGFGGGALLRRAVGIVFVVVRVVVAIVVVVVAIVVIAALVVGLR